MDEFKDAPNASGDAQCGPSGTAACYDGPAKTEGVGLCKAGLKKCNGDGIAYGACEGQVTPAAETCENPADEDCDGKDCVRWAKVFGDVSDQTARAVAVDPEGDIILGGDFQGTVAFDPSHSISANGSGIYITKFSSTGRPLWSKGFSSTGIPHLESEGVDAAGNIFIAGTFDEPLNLGGQVMQPGGYSSTFLAKLTPDGSLVWSRQIDQENQTDTPAISVDASGNVAILGRSVCTACDYGFASTLWLSKYHSDGTLAWSKRFKQGTVGGEQAIDNRTVGGAAFDPFGNILITGAFAGSEDFGGSTLTSAGGSDAFIAKFDATGNHVWSARYGDSADQVGRGITTGALGELIVTGQYAGQINFGDTGSQLTSLGGNDIFVVKISSGRNHLWSRSFGAAGDQEGLAVALDKNNNIVITGSTIGAVDFGGGKLPAGGGIDLPLVKLDPNGRHIWSKVFGATQDQIGRAIATSASADILLAGGVKGSLNVGAGDVSAAGGFDIFVAQFAP